MREALLLLFGTTFTYGLAVLLWSAETHRRAIGIMGMSVIAIFLTARPQIGYFVEPGETPEGRREAAAQAACIRAIEASALQPSTISIGGIGYDSSIRSDGSASVRQPFSVSDTYGNQSRFLAHCEIGAAGDAAARIVEAD